MVYVSADGTIGSRSPWSPSRIVELFWAVVNVVVLFFQTLFQPDKYRRGDSYTSGYGSRSNRYDPPGPPRRRMGGFSNTLDCSSAPMGGG